MNAYRELDWLAQRYLDGQSTPQELAQLNATLRQDAAARREFAEMLNLDSALATVAADWAAEKAEVATAGGDPRQPGKRLLVHPPAVRWLALAAAIVVLLGGAWGWQAARRACAIVANDVGAAGLNRGAALRHEAVELPAGTVELVTARGARVVIEAPAAFRFESAERLHVMHGRVAAHVPPRAKGFTVITPTGRAVDLGTDFGVDVPRQGAAEVHVFNGEVIAEAAGSRARQSLRDGEAVALQPGAGAAREVRSAAFIRPDEVAGLSAGLTAGRRAHSEAAAGQLRRDPALIALLDFEGDTRYAGTFRHVQGRWPGSRAPEFGQVGDRLKVDVGGDRAWPQFTMAAWVRIDRLGEPYQSLYHTDGWQAGDKPGQVHWMINRDMTMRLALRDNTLPAGAGERSGYPDSRTSVLAEQGRWMHLAVVYDATARTVQFYLNGRLDREARQEIAMPARFGPAQIGNWDAKDRKLSGRVDELIILGRAMSGAELLALFTAGSPYQ